MNTILTRSAWMICWLLALGSLNGCVFVSLSDPFDTHMREVVVEPAKKWSTTEKIALIEVSGFIGEKTGGLFRPSRGTAETLRDMLRAVEKDPKVVAVVLKINSPGGGVTTSDICYRELKAFKKRTAEQGDSSLPVFAAIMDVAASGGYYIAVGADELWAHPTSLVGSIGVIATFPNISGLIELLGVGVQVVKSGEKKDMGSIWRTMTLEEATLYQTMINAMYDRFVGIVAENRGALDETTVRKLADGRVYTAGEALGNGLIDHVGYLDDVIAAAQKKAGVDDAAVVTYGYGSQTKTNIYSHSPALDSPPVSAGSTRDMPLIHVDAGEWLDTSRPRLLYLWRP